ncbi:MAG: Ig-like domain repeat protein, partial [Methanothrix sp.]|nr:Ig-like domain repeat protein [Methanothrix sp.]
GVGVFGQPITATVNVAGSQGGTPNSGTVDVTTAYTGPQSPGPSTTPSCSLTVFAGQATCSLNFSAAGNWSISAKYNGNTNFQSSTMTPSQSYSLGKAATTLSISSLPVPSLADQTVTFTVSLSVVSPGSGTPAGNFTLTATPAAPGNPGPTTRTTTWATSGGNQGTITFNGSGSWSVVAKFTDSSGNFLDYTLPAVGYTTALNTSTTSISPPPPATISGNTLDVKFSVGGLTPNGTAPASGGNNDVTVYAYNGITQASSCHASLATGTCQLNNLNTPGTIYTIYAVYAGNYLFATSTSLLYNVTR